MDVELKAIQLDEVVQEVRLHREEARRTQIPQGLEEKQQRAELELFEENRTAGATAQI